MERRVPTLLEIPEDQRAEAYWRHVRGKSLCGAKGSHKRSSHEHRGCRFRPYNGGSSSRGKMGCVDWPGNRVRIEERDAISRRR
ncbi:hypothetical protein [Ktedonobacter sp. SOSP1-52]|uniref:hypothetical protein n=1 Tax=Ktedonobacter sp. SOSP1-52 TaxID=2778366 RepID=UPI0019150BAC|nr:hypothetical protein [Ktedonobacter sp. SOSP1-52]